MLRIPSTRSAAQPALLAPLTPFSFWHEYARTSLKIIKENPARGIKKPPEGRQRRFLNMDEIATLGEVIRAAEATGESATGIAVVRLLLLTGFRRMEALALPWSWLDRRSQCVRFEDTKSGYQLRPIGRDAL